MPAKHECHNCGRLVSECSAIETVEYDLWGDPMPVWACRECYGAVAPTAEPGQPTLDFPNQRADKNAA
jgi:hypothetical protein